jgi:hypothetical protein
MMKRVVIILTGLLPFLAVAQKNKKMKVIDIFKTYITGDFDNSAQVTAEIKAGKQVHPLAIHVNRVADDKIQNKPADLNGFFIIEESYYLYEGKPLDIKPYLFHFRQGSKANEVTLTVYQLPGGIKKETFRNDNDTLLLDYNSLLPSPTFKGATYTWNAAGKTFTTNTPNDLPGGMKFTLTEKFTKDTLEVMELLEKDGKRLTAYDTPLIYQRKK